MRGFGITYFQDTVKDRQMENLCSKSIKTCPCPYAHKPHQEHSITMWHHHFYWRATETDAFIVEMWILL